MKKIIAVLLSINLLVLNASPTLAQITPRAARGIGKAIKAPTVKLPTPKLPAGLKAPAANVVFSKRAEQAVLSNMRLPLTQNYTALLGNHNTLLPPARRILLHDNTQERALLLRSDFVALALNDQASAKDIQEAANFYRANLQELSPKQKTADTVGDIAALGILGRKEDGELIYQTTTKFQGTPQEAAITAAAARALLRLEAYEELENLDDESWVQPELWDGINDYAKSNSLPVTLLRASRETKDIASLQKDLVKYGPVVYVAVNPSLQSTYLYMNAGRGPLAVTPLAKTPVATTTPTQAVPAPVPLQEGQLDGAEQPAVSAETAPTPENLVVAPTQTAALAMADKAAADVSHIKPLAKIKTALKNIAPKPFDPEQPVTWAQKAALYLTAFSISLEIGTPIMASIKTALNLPLSYAILVTMASFSPYLFGSFIANWLKTKIGRKGTINAGLALAGGSFALGATGLGLDGSFTAWDNPLAQYFALLGILTTAGTGCVFIHNAVGPIMTEISHKANELVRQQRGTYIELSRSVGMMASFAFPFIATSMLGLDWSAPFVLALPFVATSAVALNMARLPNTKPIAQNVDTPKAVQSPLTDGRFKARKVLKWKNSILNNSYVRLLREEPGVRDFIGALFLMNGVEVALQSGFLFMVPQLTKSESTQYLLGMIQYAVAFLAGRYLAAHFLKWFPKHNISVATLLATAGGVASLASTHNAAALTASLFLAELGISTGFTLAFARTARNHATQDRITSLIMATAISCAVGPYLLTQVAQGLMSAGILGETDATIVTLLAIPSVLALLSARLFRKMENKTMPGLKAGAQSLGDKIKKFFKQK